MGTFQAKLKKLVFTRLIVLVSTGGPAHGLLHGPGYNRHQPRGRHQEQPPVCGHLQPNLRPGARNFSPTARFRRPAGKSFSTRAAPPCSPTPPTSSTPPAPWTAAWCSATRSAIPSTTASAPTSGTFTAPASTRPSATTPSAPPRTASTPAFIILRAQTPTT